MSVPKFKDWETQKFGRFEALPKVCCFFFCLEGGSWELGGNKLPMVFCQNPMTDIAGPHLNGFKAAKFPKAQHMTRWHLSNIFNLFFTPKIVEMIQFDLRIFFNHQLDDHLMNHGTTGDNGRVEHFQMIHPFRD